MLVAMLAATGGPAPPYLVGQAIDAGIQSGDAGALRLVVAAFLLTAVVYWGATYAETYRGVGRPARATGSPPADSRTSRRCRSGSSRAAGRGC